MLSELSKLPSWDNNDDAWKELGQMFPDVEPKHLWNKDGSIITIDLPGVPKEKVTVTVKKNFLLVTTAEMPNRPRSIFSVKPAPTQDVKKAACKMQDGVLTITFSPAEEIPAITLPVE
jgi:HSP20 family molecular chaperone IbpA